jgi:hypothetical protein
MFSQSAKADQAVSVEYKMPVRVDCVVDESGCHNSPGPQVTLSGAIELGSLDARVTFKNNSKGTHKAVVDNSYDVTLLLGGKIEIPKQPVLGGVGGNPHIWLQFHDGNGKDLCKEIYLGRCVQGLEVSADLVMDALAFANVHAEGCSNHPGPTITMDGGLVLGGLHGRLIFRNAVRGPHVAEDSQDVAIILEGSSIELPKQPVNGGAGGNPIICIQFLDGNGDPIGKEIRLGRCNQI